MLPVITDEPVIIQKTPDAEFDIEIDWTCESRGLGDDTIDSSEWSFTGADEELELYNPSIGTPATSTGIWMRDGTLNKFYAVTNTITTSGARVLQETFILQIVENIFIVQPRRI